MHIAYEGHPRLDIRQLIQTFGRHPLEAPISLKFLRKSLNSLPNDLVVQTIGFVADLFETQAAPPSCQIQHKIPAPVTMHFSNG